MYQKVDNQCTFFCLEVHDVSILCYLFFKKMFLSTKVFITYLRENFSLENSNLS